MRNPVCVAFLLLAGFLLVSGTRMDAAESLGEVALSVVRLSDEDSAGPRGGRLAVLLVDCSNSMLQGVAARNPGPGNPQRWKEVRTGIQECLESLQKASPGIEVRLRFFASSMDCLPPVAARLSGADDVQKVLASVPESAPEKGNTILYEAISRTLRSVVEENSRRGFEWVLFGVFSDGQDATSGASYRTPGNANHWMTWVERFRRDVPAVEELVTLVGPDASQFAKAGGFGDLRTAQIGARFPVPPKPRPRFQLALASGQPGWVTFKRPAVPGDYTLRIRVSGPAGIRLQDLRLRPELAAASSFRISPSTPGLDASGQMELAFTLPPGPDLSAGVSLPLVLKAGEVSGSGAVFRGEVGLTFTFLASGTLETGRWQFSQPRVVRARDEVRFGVNPGSATDPVWEFRPGPSGAPESERGLAVVHRFSRAGEWSVRFSCVSDVGRPMSRSGETVQVVDSDFDLEPGSGRVRSGEGASLRVKPRAGAISPASFTVLVDGQSGASIDGSRVVIPESLLGQIGSHSVVVTATSQVGSFEWTHEASIDVVPAPRILILGPTSFAEGAAVIPVGVQVSGDLGSRLEVFLDGRRLDLQVPVSYENPSLPVRQISVPIPSATLTGRRTRLELRAANGACAPASVVLEGRPADVAIRLRRPLDGSSITASRSGELEIDWVGEDVDSIGEATAEIAVLPQGTGATPGIDARSVLQATRVSGWKVGIPSDLGVGKVTVFGRPSGGRLLPALFPEGKEWRQLGTLTVTPKALWHWWLLCVLVLAALTYVLAKLLLGNAPLRWELEFGFEDPGKPSDLGVALARLPVGRPFEHPERRFPAYQGWSRWHKEAFIPLWVLRDRADSVDAEWLAGDSVANLRFRVRNFWKNPFARLPDYQQGWAEPERIYTDEEGAPSTSATYRLIPPPDGTRIPRSLWLRMRCPKGGDPLLWILWVWIFIALSACLGLLPVFHIV